jgi:Rha family phage regulatory protein
MATLLPPIDSPVVVLRAGKAWAPSDRIAAYTQQQHGHLLEKRRKLTEADPDFAAANFLDHPYKAPSGRTEPGFLVTAAALRRFPFRHRLRDAIAQYLEALDNRSPELAQTVAASFGLPADELAPPPPVEDEDPDLPPLYEPVVLVDGMRVFATTLDIAAFFQRRHKDVLVIVRDIIKLQQDFAGPNFRPDSAPGANGKAVPAFEVTEEGFTIIVGRFSRPEALAFQIRYIRRFKEMEAELKAQALPPPPPPEDDLHPDAPRDYESSLEALLAKEKQLKLERAATAAAEQRAVAAEHEKAPLPRKRRKSPSRRPSCRPR